MVRVCVISLREEDKGMGVGMGGGGGRGKITGHNTPPPPKKTHFDRQQGNPVGIWVRVGLGGSGRAWYLLAVNSAPSVCVCGGGGGGAFFVGINMIWGPGWGSTGVNLEL